MATIKDVAQRAGVSVATVSNYLNKTKPVSRQAGQRIDEAVAALNYTQNLAAKSLKSNAHPNIGVILPNLSDSYYVQIYQGIESAFRGTGHYLNLAFSYDLPELEAQIAEDMLRRQVGGLILVTCQPDQWKFYYENFLHQDRPLVLIDREITSLDTDLVSFDSHRVLRAVTESLLAAGCREPVLMAGPEKFTCESACIRGFREAFPEGNVISLALDKEDAFRKTTGLLRDRNPDAILATSELTATGIVEAMEVLGYAPDRLPVITLGEEHWNRHTHSFAAFSVNRPAIRLGALAADTLLRRIQSPATQETCRETLSCPIAPLVQELKDTLFPGQPEVPALSAPSIRVLLLDTPAVHTFCRLLKNFETRTGIRVETVLCLHNTLFNTILRGHDTGEYDICMYDIPWLPMLAAGGILRDLGREPDRIDTSAFLPDCMEYYSRFGDGFYGVPLMYAPQMLYYRKSLFEDPILRAKYEKLYGAPLKPPRTFTEFNTVAKFFTQDTDAIPYGMAIPAAYPECLAPEIYMRLRSYDSEVIDRRGNVIFQSPNTLKAYVNLIRSLRYAKPDYLNATDVDVVDSFLRGETAMLITYPGFLTNVSDLRKNNRLGSIGCSYIPGRAPLLGGWGLGISSRSTRHENAFRFLSWACNENMGNYFSMLGGYTAVTSTYTNDELVNLYPWLPLYKEIYPYTRPMLPSLSRKNRVVSPNDIDSIICKGFYRLLTEEIEIEEILAQTQKEIEALLSSDTK